MLTLSDVASGPSRLRFYELNIIQNEAFSSSIDGDEKLCAIDPLPLSRVRLRQADEEINSIKRTALMSVNANIGWLDITVFVLCAFYASHLHQKLREARLSALMSKGPALTLLKRHGTLSMYI